MKKTILTIGMALAIFTAKAQEAVGVQVTQDVKLATFSNDKAGNKPFTTDIQVKMVMQGNDSNTGYLVISPKYEFANLAGGEYHRYGAEIGYSFHTYIFGIDIAPLAGFGYSHRFGQRWFNLEFSVEGKLPVTTNLSVIALMNINQRMELENSPWKYNVGIGLRWDFSTAWNNKPTRF